MATCETCKNRYSDDVRICPADGTFLTPSQAKTDPFLGKVIDNKYRVIEKIGDGGMGSVYKAEHLLMNRTVALKVLRRSLAGDSDNDEFLRRFQSEARTASKINHPNAVTIHDFGIEGDSPYIVMEFNSGKSLKEIIETDGSLPPARILGIMTQVCEAIDEAHALGIVHRDLKPDNIMISHRRDGSDLAMVLDFGIAKILSSGEQGNSARTKTGAMIGTPKYMSPEQVMSTAIDNRSDIYSLGIILYEMLSGEVPFDSDSAMSLMMQHVSELPRSLRELNSELRVSEQVESVVLRALKKVPDERQPTVTDFLKDLRHAIEHSDTSQRLQSSSAVVSTDTGTPTNPNLLRRGVISAAIAAVIFGAYSFIFRPAPDREQIVQLPQNEDPSRGVRESAANQDSPPIESTPSTEKLLEEGIAHIERGNFENAEVALKRVIELEPENVAAYRKIAAIYTKLGRDEEALGYWEEATHRDTSDARAFAILGLTYKKLGKLFEARVALNKAVTLDSALAMAKENLSEVDSAIAEESMKRERLSAPISSLVEQLRSDNRETRAEAANLLQEHGAEAIAPLTEELKNSDPRVRYWAADVLGRLKATGATAALIDLLRDQSDMVQESAVRALQQLDTPEATTALTQRAEEQRIRQQRVTEKERKQTRSGIGGFFDNLFN